MTAVPSQSGAGLETEETGKMSIFALKYMKFLIFIYLKSGKIYTSLLWPKRPHRSAQTAAGAVTWGKVSTFM